MGAQSDRLRCEVCQNLILSPINTGFLRYAVATVLTVYGIETSYVLFSISKNTCTLQQCLPFTVLKPTAATLSAKNNLGVATVLTVYGIETLKYSRFTIPTIIFTLQQCLPFTVLKLYAVLLLVKKIACCNSAYRLRY